MAATEPESPERDGMSVSNWITKTFHLKAKPELSSERVDLVRETYDKVSEVRKLREDVLEGRNFPISSYLRGDAPHKTHSRRKGDGLAE